MSIRRSEQHQYEIQTKGIYSWSPIQDSLHTQMYIHIANLALLKLLFLRWHDWGGGGRSLFWFSRLCIVYTVDVYVKLIFPLYRMCEEHFLMLNNIVCSVCNSFQNSNKLKHIWMCIYSSCLQCRSKMKSWKRSWTKQIIGDNLYDTFLKSIFSGKSSTRH